MEEEFMNNTIHDKLLCLLFSFTACINAGNKMNVTNVVLPAYDAFVTVTPTAILSRYIVPTAGKL